MRPVLLLLAGAASASCPAACGDCVASGGGGACVSRCGGCRPECSQCLAGGGGVACLRHCNPIADQVDAILNGAQVKQNTWTVLLQNEWGNLTYYERDADVARIPASNTKVWTTGCAYDQIGWDVVWPWDDNRTVLQGCRDILKPSWNEGADQLLAFVGTRVVNTTSTQRAADFVLDWAARTVGLDMSGAAMGDGCGLDRDNRFSARQMVGVLRWLTHRFTDWQTALPIGCVDGTLADRFCAADGSGRVHAKTGTLHDVHAVSGYLDNRHDGKRYYFGVIANNCDPALAAESVAAIDAVGIAVGQAGIPNP